MMEYIQMVYILTILYSLVGDVLSTASLCPGGGWYNTQFGICYWLETTLATGTGMNDLCATWGGTLAVFPTYQEYNWIVYLIAPTSITPVISGPLWIGMTDSATEGTYLSFEGDPTTYTVWHSGNPTDDGTLNKDCVYMDKNNNYDMYDESCSTMLPGLCSLTLGYCPAGSYYLADKMLCYWATSNTDDADGGNFTCGTSGGSLAVIPDADVNTELGNSPMNNLLSGASRFFIGVTDRDVEGNWKSYLGEPITWTNWASLEPNDPDIGGFPAQDCVFLESSSRQWRDEVCTTPYMALCYRDLSPYEAVQAALPTTAGQAPDTTTVTETTTNIETTTTESITTTESVTTTGSIMTTELTTDGTTETSHFTTTSNNAYNPSTSNTAIEECECPCESETLTQEEINQVVEEIKNRLSVDVKSTSAYLRTKVSVYEDRPSAQNIGVVGVVILCFVFGSIIIMDVGTLFQHIKNCGKAPVND